MILTKPFKKGGKLLCLSVQLYKLEGPENINTFDVDDGQLILPQLPFDGVDGKKRGTFGVENVLLYTFCAVEMDIHAQFMGIDAGFLQSFVNNIQRARAGLSENQRNLEQMVCFDFVFLKYLVSCAGNQHDLVFDKRLIVQLLMPRNPLNEGHIDVLGYKLLFHKSRVARYQVNVDGGVGTFKNSENSRQYILGQGGTRPYFQHAAGDIFQLGKLILKIDIELKNPAGVFQQYFSGRRQSDAAAIPDKQAGFELRLQLIDVLRDGWLGNKKLCCGLRKAQLLCHRIKHL